MLKKIINNINVLIKFTLTIIFFIFCFFISILPMGVFTCIVQSHTLLKELKIDNEKLHEENRKLFNEIESLQYDIEKILEK